MIGFLFLFLSMSMLSPKALGKGSVQNIVKESNEFTAAEGTYRIEAVVREVTEPYTYENFSVNYSVYKDGIFLSRGDRTGGSTWGCLYGNKRVLPKQMIKPLKLGKRQIGWSFDLLGICGNTTSKHIHWVVVWPKTGRHTYYTKDFIAKTDPILQVDKTEESATVWYVFQEWGDGGTASSFFVPRVFTIRTLAPNTYSPFAPADLPKDLSLWPSFEGLTYTAPSYVGAGIQALNGAPITQIAATLTDKDAESLKWVGLPSTRQDLQRLADELQGAGPTLLKFQH